MFTGKHSYTATLSPAGAIVVTDEQGNEVKVRYSATQKWGACTAYVEGIGYIGGWRQRRKQKEPFKNLVASINRGIVYHDMNDLPNIMGEYEK